MEIKQNYGKPMPLKDLVKILQNELEKDPDLEIKTMILGVLFENRNRGIKATFGNPIDLGLFALEFMPSKEELIEFEQDSTDQN